MSEIILKYILFFMLTLTAVGLVGILIEAANRKRHKASLEYMFKGFSKDGPMPAPARIEVAPTKRIRKGRIYSPKRDTHKHFTGEIVDPYDDD